MSAEENYQESLSVTQILGIIRRNFFGVLLSVLLCAALAVLATDYIPDKYKSKAVLSIQSGYFQHPLVRDLISETQDPGELSARRLSLLRLALNDNFLDRLGVRFGFYEHPYDARLRILDREEFLKKIEYFAVSPTSFQISIISPDASSAFMATKEVLNQMTFTLIEQRYQTLMQAREAILKQARLLSKSLNSPEASTARDVLEAQLAKMESSLAALRSRYTESHPQVVKLRSQSRALESRLKNMPATTAKPSEAYNEVFLNPASRASSQEIFDDLLKKLSHLNIVLEMERDRQNVSYLTVIEQPTIPTQPFFPNPLEFALYGALTGLVLSGIRVTYSELRRSSHLSPEKAAFEFDFDLLGELPPFESRHRALFLNPPPAYAALPPAQEEM